MAETKTKSTGELDPVLCERARDELQAREALSSQWELETNQDTAVMQLVKALAGFGGKVGSNPQPKAVECLRVGPNSARNFPESKSDSPLSFPLIVANLSSAQVRVTQMDPEGAKRNPPVAVFNSPIVLEPQSFRVVHKKLPCLRVDTGASAVDILVVQVQSGAKNKRAPAQDLRQKIVSNEEAMAEIKKLAPVYQIPEDQMVVRVVWWLTGRQTNVVTGIKQLNRSKPADYFDVCKARVKATDLEKYLVNIANLLHTLVVTDANLVKHGKELKEAYSKFCKAKLSFMNCTVEGLNAESSQALWFQVLLFCVVANVKLQHPDAITLEKVQELLGKKMEKMKTLLAKVFAYADRPDDEEADENIIVAESSSEEEDESVVNDSPALAPSRFIEDEASEDDTPKEKPKKRKPKEKKTKKPKAEKAKSEEEPKKKLKKEPAPVEDDFDLGDGLAEELDTEMKIIEQQVANDHEKYKADLEQAKNDMSFTEFGPLSQNLAQTRNLFQIGVSSVVKPRLEISLKEYLCMRGTDKPTLAPAASKFIMELMSVEQQEDKKSLVQPSPEACQDRDVGVNNDSGFRAYMVHGDRLARLAPFCVYHKDEAAKAKGSLYGSKFKVSELSTEVMYFGDVQILESLEKKLKAKFPNIIYSTRIIQ